MREPVRRKAGWLPASVLAVAIYVPLLLTKPGRVGADTKTYLYLDPGKLLSRAWSMWDPSIGLGTVSHQNVGYLWPMGPWYWLFDRAGVPDWVAQRLWVGTILFAAGAGVLWLLRRVLGWATAPAAAAAFVYAFTPYVMTLAARLSVILLPFAGLPWMIGLTALSIRQRTWRYPALFALVVVTVGSVNATALLLAGLGPALWVLYARLAGEASTGTIVRAVGRIGVTTIAVNLWWIAGLWAQGSYGIEILRYTETAETVASAAVAAEVLRGLGYWFFYGGDRLGPWIEPGRSYTQRLPLIALTYALPIAALLGGALARWRERAFFVALTAVGVLAAVGAHPWDDGPPGARVVQDFLLSDTGLAMRSLPRAAPLVVLGLAALVGAGVGRVPVRFQARAAIAVAAAAYLALPPLWTGGMVASNLDRPEDIPSYWLDAARYLDSRDDGTRVLEVPGIDFASYRWGNTVDPITPGLIDRPYVARELIPYGSPASADLISAIDRRIQERSLEPGALTVLARLLGVGDVVLRDDLQYERYRTPRPYELEPRLAAEPGLGESTPFGTPVVNKAIDRLPLIDELALLTDDQQPRPPVEVFPVDDPVPMVRSAPADGGVVVAGDGEGLVDVAAAGLLHGDELVRYGASLGRDGVAAALDDGAALVVTDGNRRQGRRWSTVRDTLGDVEGEPALKEDLTDNRLPLFPDAEEGWETRSDPLGSVTATATSYGNRISFTPEYRPQNAVDGDLTTEWRTAANADARGERLRLTYDPPVSASTLTLVQQLSGFRNRHITTIDVRVNDGDPQRLTLDDASLSEDGQELTIDTDGPVSSLDIEIVADSAGRSGSFGRPVRYEGLTQVGFAEVRLDDGDTNRIEALRLPPAATASIDADSPVALVLTRWRTDPAEVVREDPEPQLARTWSQPVARTYDVAGTVELSPHADDGVLDDVLGARGARVSASSRLVGSVVERGSAALDGDPTTWWSPRFGDDEPALTVTAEAPVTFDDLDLQLVDDDRRSVPTRLRIEADGDVAATVDVPAGGGRIDLPSPVTGTTFRFVIEAIDARSVIEWYSDAPTNVPPAIAELGIDALRVHVPSAGGSECRDDLLTIDGQPLPIRIDGDRFESCDPVAVGAGEHALLSVSGRETGIDVDQVVLTSGAAPAGLIAPRSAGDAPVVDVRDSGRASVDVHVEGATPGEPFWLVLGQSYNEGWRLGGRGPDLVDGYSAAWLVTPDAASFDASVVWKPQRVVSVALVLSALAAVGCVVLAARRPRASEAAGGHLPGPLPGWLRWPWLVPIVAATGSLVWIGPVSAVVVTAFAVAGVWRPSTLRWLRLGPAVALGAAAIYALARQAIARPHAAFEWPAELATAHQPALVAVALLAVVVALDRPRRQS